jgi:hypothetical protein
MGSALAVQHGCTPVPGGNKTNQTIPVGVDSIGRKIHHFQGFKMGNLTIFLADVFILNSHPISQTLGMPIRQPNNVM